MTAEPGMTSPTLGDEWADFLGMVHDFTSLFGKGKSSKSPPAGLLAKSSKAKSVKEAKAHKVLAGKASKSAWSKSAKRSKSAKSTEGRTSEQVYRQEYVGFVEVQAASQPNDGALRRTMRWSSVFVVFSHYLWV